MPILEAVAGGYLVGKGAIFISATLGGGLVMAGNYFFGKQSAKDKEALERLTVIKETREQARVQNLSEVVEGLEQRKQHLDEASLKHQEQMEVIADGFDKDKALINEQAEHLAKTNSELEQCIKEQQAMLLSLQLAFKEKMEAFDQAQKELLESKAEFEKNAQELAQAREDATRSKEELVKVKEDLSLMTEENREKQTKVDELEASVDLLGKSLEQNEARLEEALLRNKALVDNNSSLAARNKAYKDMIKTLTEELEQAKGDTVSTTTTPPTPRFFS